MEVDLNLVGAVLCILIGGCVLWFAHSAYRFDRFSRGWPTAAGIVVETRIDEVSGGDDGFRYMPVVAYRYQVSGIEYTSDRMQLGVDRVHGVTNGSHSEAERFLKAFEKGTSVAVKYNPVDPGSSVVIEGFPKHWFTFRVGTGTFFLVWGALLLLKAFDVVDVFSMLPASD